MKTKNKFFPRKVKNKTSKLSKKYKNYKKNKRYSRKNNKRYRKKTLKKKLNKQKGGIPQIDINSVGLIGSPIPSANRPANPMITPAPAHHKDPKLNNAVSSALNTNKVDELVEEALDHEAVTKKKTPTRAELLIDLKNELKSRTRAKTEQDREAALRARLKDGFDRAISELASQIQTQKKIDDAIVQTKENKKQRRQEQRDAMFDNVQKSLVNRYVTFKKARLAKRQAREMEKLGLL